MHALRAGWSHITHGVADIAPELIVGEDRASFPSRDLIDMFHEPDTRRLIANLTLHIADISNSFKPFRISRIWAGQVPCVGHGGGGQACECAVQGSRAMLESSTACTCAVGHGSMRGGPWQDLVDDLDVADGWSSVKQPKSFDLSGSAMASAQDEWQMSPGRMWAPFASLHRSVASRAVRKRRRRDLS